jgi:hypothetical protein
MKEFLKLHLHPLGGRIIFWNFVLLILVKMVIPNSAFQSASLLGLVPSFDSREIIKSTNEARVANNLTALSPNAKLDIAASEKLNDMAIQEYFAHISPSGVNPWYWIKSADYRYSLAGENLAIGFVTAGDTVKAWLNSPSHRANILNTKYKEIGVAVKSVEINGREGILVVQMFGSPLNQIASNVAKTPAPTPVPTSSQLAVNSPAVIPSTAQTRGESISIVQEISTDVNIKSVDEPVAVKSDDAEKIVRISEILNNTFSIYTALIAMASMFAFFFFFQKNKNMALKLSLNLGLLLLTILIPAYRISLEGLIF